jgi:Membrane bound beta barrel domain (DUF5777)
MTKIAILALAVVAGAAQATAQEPAPAPPSNNAAPQADAPSDRALNPSEPDFTLIGLPTTLRMPKFASAFRVTHRFTRPLGQGDFGDLASDLFGLDGGGLIGLEYRFGIMSGTQIGIHRTSDKVIELFGQQQVVRQGDRSPVTVDALATIEGRDNFSERYSPAIGVVISRTLGAHGAVYAHPFWVGNTNLFEDDVVDEDNTFVIGLGARLRVRPTVYVVFEAGPRVGYDPGSTHISFGVEKRAGGHAFQLNFGNDLATTMAPIARGGFDYENWFIGFNISRKFF